MDFSSTDSSNSSSSSYLQANFAFNTTVPFTSLNGLMAIHTVNAPLNFTANSATAKPMCCTLVRLIANGVNEPSFASFKKSTNSSAYNNTAGVFNCIYICFDGLYYWYNIWQEQNAQPLDSVAPLLQSAVVNNSLKNRIVLTYNEPLANVLPAINSINVVGKIVNGVSIVGSTLLVDVTVPFVENDVIQMSYTPGVFNIQDVAGNAAAGLNLHPVVNNINSNVIFDILGPGITFNAANNTLNSNSNQSGAYQSELINLTNNFVLSTEFLNDAATLCLDTNIDNNYAWGGSNNFLFSFFKFAGNIGITDNRTGSFIAAYSQPHAENFVRIKKVNNDAVFEKSLDGISWSNLTTILGMFANVPSVYIKAIFAASGTGNLILKAKLIN